MRDLTFIFLAALCLASGSFAKKGFGPGEQEWDYVEVRPNAHMFWWLYYTTANVNSFYEKPLLIWLQGGPGASSTSFGNFEEIGPLDVSLKARNYTWVKDYNVLFIDNPVGTGFSFVSNNASRAGDNKQIAADLVECMKGFLEKLPEFANVPTYITTESYGGKMGAEFALVWYREQQAGFIKSNLKGVVLGDAWISPIDTVMSWAPYLLATGMIDNDGYNKIDEVARATKNFVDTEKWHVATAFWAYTEGAIVDATNNIDFYNILTKLSPSTNRKSDVREKLTRDLSSLMNGPVKQTLGLSSTHCVQCNGVFNKLRGDFMKPVINIVELLLNETDLKVVVLNGHLDLIVDTPGTLFWVEKLKWKGSEAWLHSSRTPLVAHNIIEGYVKSYGNFAMYWVNRAGHMVPKDNPAATAKILEDLVSNKRL